MREAVIGAWALDVGIGSQGRHFLPSSLGDPRICQGVGRRWMTAVDAERASRPEYCVYYSVI